MVMKKPTKNMCWLCQISHTTTCSLLNGFIHMVRARSYLVLHLAYQGQGSTSLFLSLVCLQSGWHKLIPSILGLEVVDSWQGGKSHVSALSAVARRLEADPWAAGCTVISHFFQLQQIPFWWHMEQCESAGEKGTSFLDSQWHVRHNHKGSTLL